MGRTQATMATVCSMAFLICSLTVVAGIKSGSAQMAGVALHMNLTVQAFWLRTAPQDCMVDFSCAKDGHLENLYIHCNNSTELYKYKSNLFYEKSGNAVKFTVTEGIPESKKVNPLFPLGFCMEGNGNKGMVEGLLSEESGWHADRTVTVLGETHQCKISIANPRAGEQRPHRAGDAPSKGYCHLMPQDVAAHCGAGKTILNYMFHCTDKVDWTIFEPSPDEVMDISTEPQTKKPIDDTSGRYIIIIGVTIIIVFILVLALAVVLAWRCGWRLTRKAPSHLAQYGRAEEIVALNPNAA